MLRDEAPSILYEHKLSELFVDNSDKSRGCDRIKDNYKQECRLKRHVHYEPNHRSNSNCRNPNSRTFDIFWLVINLNETNFVKEWKD